MAWVFINDTLSSRAALGRLPAECVARAKVSCILGLGRQNFVILRFS